MTFRNLDNRIGRLESVAPRGRGELIDLASLTPEQLAVWERSPWLSNGDMDVHAIPDEDLRILAGIKMDGDTHRRTAANAG